jgi:hypothetical protein
VLFPLLVSTFSLSPFRSVSKRAETAFSTTGAGLLSVAANVSIVSHNVPAFRVFRRIVLLHLCSLRSCRCAGGHFPERGPCSLQTFIIYFLQSFMGFFYYAFYMGDFAMLRSYLFSRLVTNAVSSPFFDSCSFVLS